MNQTNYQTETVRLTRAEFAALQWVDAQSWLDDYADPDNEAQTIEDDDLTPEEWAEEHAKAKLCRLEPGSFTFVRESAAFRQSVYGLGTKLIGPFELDDRERQTFTKLRRKLKLGTQQ